jgi:hypothetical protein
MKAEIVVRSTHAAQIKVLQPFPQDKTVTYSETDMPMAAWVLAHWEADGYKVPKDGDTFVWRKYAIDIPDLASVQKDDVVIFEGDSPGFELALVYATDMEDATKIAVIQPLKSGLIIIHVLDRDKILGVCRPIGGKPNT